MPAAAVPALKVKVELPPAVTAVGLRLAVAPDGTPETDKETVCALPEATAVETVAVAVAPAFTDRVDGETEREKSLVGVAPLCQLRTARPEESTEVAAEHPHGPELDIQSKLIGDPLMSDT